MPFYASNHCKTDDNKHHQVFGSSKPPTYLGKYQCNSNVDQIVLLKLGILRY